MTQSKLKGLLAGFFSLLFFFVLLAGGTQIIFSSEKVEGWIRSGIDSAELENIKIDFSKARTTWTGSLRYPFGVRINNVSFIKVKTCKNVSVNFKSLVIPFSIYQAINKKTEIGIIRGYEGRHKTTPTCLKEEELNESDESRVNQSKGIGGVINKSYVEEKVTNFLFSLQDIEPLEDRENFKIRGFLFNDIQLLKSMHKNFEHSLNIERLKLGVISFKNYEGQWQGNYLIKHIDDKKSYKIKISGGLEIKKNIAHVYLSGRKKEGVLNLELKTPIFEKSDKKPFTKIEFENFPVSSLADILGLNLKLPIEKQRASWFDCLITSSFKEMSISVKSSLCSVKGDLGFYNLTTGADFSWSKYNWSFNRGLKIKISDVLLDDIYPAFGGSGPIGVFGDFGRLSIDLNLMDFDSAYAEFELKDFSILFRSKGVSAFQKGNSARGTGALITKEKFEFSVEEIDLEKGEFEGTVEGVVDLSKDELELDVEIPHLVLNPLIAKKLFQADLGFFELVGEGRFNYRKSLQDLKLSLGFNEVISKQWKLGPTKIPCIILNKVLDCTFKVDSLELSKAVAKKLEIKNKEFLNLFGSLNYYKKSLEVKAKNKESRDDLFKVSWSKDLGLEGQIRQESGVYKKLNFRGFK